MINSLLTVGLSVYTKSSYGHFKQAFESIWDEQLLRPTTIFIAYDGEVPKTIESYVDQRLLEGLPITKIILRENYGLTHTLNLMLERCQTKYFGRMDTDDISLPDRFERQIQALEDNIDLTLVGSCANDIDSNGRIIGTRQVPLGHDDIIKTLPMLNPILHPSVVFRVEKIRQYGLYDVRFRTSQDYELWFRLARLGAQFMNLDIALMHYRLDDDYKSRKSLKYRLNDVIIKMEGLKKGKFPLYTYVFLILPLVVWIVPTKYISLVKKIDPRNN